MTTLTATNTNTLYVEVSALIDAPPQKVHDIIADYRVAHPAVLPKPYFSELTIERGGFGAGTIMKFSTTVWGQTLHHHHEVTEPDPGKTLVETDLKTGQYTQFTFESANNGKQTRLIIGSHFILHSGIMGWIEKLLQPSIIRRMYQQELQNIADYVKRPQ